MTGKVKIICQGDLTILIQTTRFGAKVGILAHASHIRSWNALPSDVGDWSVHETKCSLPNMDLGATKKRYLITHDPTEEVARRARKPYTFVISSLIYHVNMRTARTRRCLLVTVSLVSTKLYVFSPKNLGF